MSHSSVLMVGREFGGNIMKQWTLITLLAQLKVQDVVSWFGASSVGMEDVPHIAYCWMLGFF